MKTEIEARLLEVDVDGFRRKLENAGASFVGDWVQSRYCYDFNPVEENRWIRLRTNGKSTTLTIKDISDKSITGTKEVEIEVSSFENTDEILNQLGYKCVLVHPGICSTNILFNKDTGLPNLFSRLGRGFLNLFTHPASKASLTTLLGLVCDYEPNMYIKPNGIFSISGYPKIEKLPKKFESSNLLDETREYLAQKVGNYVSSK